MLSNLEGWGGEGGREVPEGGDTCKLRADSQCCVAETDKLHYNASILQLKIKYKIKIILK